jgi:Rrf2 family protein
MKTDYAMRALVDLAQRQGQRPVQSADIAARQAIPEPYLDQLLTMLRKAGFIRSMRGPQGGHALARPAEQITVAAIVLLLEGSLAPTGCVDHSEDCQHGAACAIREVWQEWQTESMRLLEEISVADLVERQSRYQLALMYHI